MSGVVIDGQQWEHCNACGEFRRFPQDLGHEKPSSVHLYGRMLCVKCVDAGLRAGTIKFRQITPASSWKRVKVAR